MLVSNGVSSFIEISRRVIPWICMFVLGCNLS